MKNVEVPTERKLVIADLIAFEPTAEQAERIAAAEAEAVSNDCVDYLMSDRLVQRGSQVFAVFGSRAYELCNLQTVADDRMAYEYYPLLVNGRAILERSDYRTGISTLMRCTRRNGQPYAGQWLNSYVRTGWLHTAELDLPAAQIADRIADEIDRGANHITGIRNAA